MRNLISFMHISLDGFVAGPNGEMNWIKVDEEIFDHIGQRIEQTDTALYGRVTYDMMEGYWPTAADAPDASKHDIEHSKWYKRANKVVLSKSMEGQVRTNTTIISSDLGGRISDIKEAGSGDLLVFGSPRATHALIKEGLIDGYWLFVNPIILGKGISLFSAVSSETKLKLISTQRFTAGVTELNYLVDKQ